MGVTHFIGGQKKIPYTFSVRHGRASCASRLVNVVGVVVEVVNTLVVTHAHSSCKWHVPVTWHSSQLWSSLNTASHVRIAYTIIYIRSASYQIFPTCSLKNLCRQCSLASPIPDGPSWLLLRTERVGLSIRFSEKIRHIFQRSRKLRGWCLV